MKAGEREDAAAPANVLIQRKHSRQEMGAPKAER